MSEIETIIKHDLKHVMMKEDFYRWLSESEIRDLERLSTLEIKLSSLDSEVTEIKSDDHRNRLLDAYLHREVLPRVGTIIDRSSNRTGESIDRLKDELRKLDGNTVKKSNLTKYLGIAFSVIFTGGIGSVFAYLFDLQTKLDLVPLLQAHVEELQVKHRESEKTFFVLEGTNATLKAQFDSLSEDQQKMRSQNSELQQSVQTNSYTLTDLLERIGSQEL